MVKLTQTSNKNSTNGMFDANNIFYKTLYGYLISDLNACMLAPKITLTPSRHL